MYKFSLILLLNTWIRSGKDTKFQPIKRQFPLGMKLGTNVSVKSKLQHAAPPPKANPGHLTPLPSRGGGNLIIRVFQGVENLISMR